VCSHEKTEQIGPLHDPVPWYKIKYTGEQVAQWDFKNNAIRNSPNGPVFVLEVPMRNLLTSIFNFVPWDRIVQRAYLFVICEDPGQSTETLEPLWKATTVITCDE